MKRWIILAAVAAVAASGVACANSPMGPESAISASSDSGVFTKAAKGGNGGGGGKPGNGGGTTGGSLAPAMVTDHNGDGLPSFNDVVTFVVHTDATPYPWVTLKCYQNGTLVSQESNGMFVTALGQEFTLGPTPAWTGGAADCTATLENWDSYSNKGTISALASISFPVN